MVSKNSEKPIKILALETSCDETAAALVEDGVKILANIIYSQTEVHAEYGGVVPEIASRCHLQAIAATVTRALDHAGLTFRQIDAIAVSSGPGLAGSLLVGVSYAKALAMGLKKPLIAVHHWHGHIKAVFLEHNLQYPFLALIVSGGHSGLFKAAASNDYVFLGESLDDAAGEAFDKIARALNLGYPGGPALEKAAQGGNAHYVEFPRAWLAPGSHDFSFSGLKSAVLNYLNRRLSGGGIEAWEIPHIAASAQEAICEVLACKTVDAARRLGLKNLAAAGGVAANKRLRQLLREKGGNLNIYFPSPILCTDNAAMIGAAAYDLFRENKFADLSLNAEARKKFP
jgi:N6-L-threonylcarbamoyladenine synthase